MLIWLTKKINFVIGYLKGVYNAIMLILKHREMTTDELIYEAFHEGLIEANDIKTLINMTHNKKES